MRMSEGCGKLWGTWVMDAQGRRRDKRAGIVKREGYICELRSYPGGSIGSYFLVGRGDADWREGKRIRNKKTGEDL